ncbi:protein SICKLE [Neltuma alba]|uniref:protein SICKLE n=1 Tax=Neltuma alba TaxID=207710 RepID=UPI0010A36240|nr:protein SICKLE [Prosopis alba]XP_028777746.1 protein SICKLE [Prosopis alba]XP_028777747.1 protein SICKLE [Prosopis alba]
MEDSGQRKRRLEEMRRQAELSEAAGGIKASGSGMHSPLSNPLIETSSTMPAQDKSYSAPRFDFYTDPMAAFSPNKKKNNVQTAPDHSTPFVSSPMAPFSSPRMPPPRFPGSMSSQTTHSFTYGSPVPNRNPAWNGSRGSPQYHCPPQYQNPGFEISGRPFYNSGQHTARQPKPSPGYSHSPGLSPGRGRGNWYSTRNDGGQRLSSHGRSSGGDKPHDVDWFYKKSMVEDPWQLLKPVIWKATDASLNNKYTPENSKSWTSKSPSTNKGGPSATPIKSGSQPSLAEYLAATFNEAANGMENV